MTGPTETQIDAFMAIYRDLGKKQKQVYDIIERYKKLTRYEIAEKLNLSINQVTGRVKELEDKGLICVCGRKRNTMSGQFNEIIEVLDVPRIRNPVKVTCPRCAGRSWIWAKN